MKYEIIGIIVIFSAFQIPIFIGQYQQSKYLAAVINANSFALRTTIKANSCFHLELPNE